MRLLREWIADGTLAAGSELPSERSLADRLDVPRTTVNRALSELMDEGLIRHEGGYTRTIAGKPRLGFAADTLLILAPPIDIATPGPNGGNDQATLGALAQARVMGLHGMVVDTRQLSLDEFAALAERPWRGVVVGPILLGSRIPIEPFLGALERYRAAGIPVVGLDDDLFTYGYDVVSPDHEAGAYAVTQRLLAAGVKQPIFHDLGTPQPPWLKARYAGFVRALNEAGVDVPQDLIVPEISSLDDDHFTLAARHYVGFLIERFGSTIEHRPDAIVAINDHFALRLAHSVRLLGLDPERDLKIVGFDANADGIEDSQYEHFRPWCSVDRDMYACGMALTRLIRERQRLGPGEAKRILLPPRLVPEQVIG